MLIPRKILSTVLPSRGIRARALVALGAGWLLFASSGVSLAALDTPQGPPPCGRDGMCNLAACNQDPDCPAGLPNEQQESHPDSALDAVIDCNSTQEKDIRAVAWNIVDDWSNFERRVENATDKNLGNCIEKRFSTNGKVRCVSEYNCNDKGCKLGHAAGLSQQMKIYQTFFDNIAALPQADRRACYAGLMTHEFSHSCERYSDGPNSAAELREDAAFNYWKNRFAVSSTLDPNNACGFD
jgi:hypothetical protein